MMSAVSWRASASCFSTSCLLSSACCCSASALSSFCFASAASPSALCAACCASSAERRAFASLSSSCLQPSSNTATRTSFRIPRSLLDRHLHRRDPGLVLGRVVEVRARRGRLVAARRLRDQVELDVLLRRGCERAEVHDHLARARLVEVDDALVAQLLELPGLERQAAR